MREQPGIQEDRLRACLQEHYAISPLTLEFLALGLDYNAGVYRVVSEQDTAYLLKIKSGTLYEPGCLMPYYLNQRGITSAVSPLPTKSKALWVRLDTWTVIVYPFIEGDTSWTGMTEGQWQEVGATFERIHQTPLPSAGFGAIRKETFNPTAYIQWIQNFETQYLPTPGGGRASEQNLRASWITHQSKIHTATTALEKLGIELQKRPFSHVIAHADLHPANLLRTPTGQVFVIDWDEVMLAPRERDFIYVREAPSDAFWKGYGEHEIDWTALSYYLWERVIQDLIECAKEVCFSEDRAEEARADAFQLFHQILTEEWSDINVAKQAMTHLPSNLIDP